MGQWCVLIPPVVVRVCGGGLCELSDMGRRSGLISVDQAVTWQLADGTSPVHSSLSNLRAWPAQTNATRKWAEEKWLLCYPSEAHVKLLGSNRQNGTEATEVLRTLSLALNQIYAVGLV